MTIAAFGAGVATSTGPCVAPRFLAAAALCTDADRRRRSLRLGAFIAGSLLTFVVVCYAGTAVARIATYSVQVYAVMGILCVVAGAAGILRAHSCERERPPRSYGAAFFCGAGAGMVGSPCCGPLVALGGIGWSAAGHDPFVPAAFALGHALPLGALAVGSFERIKETLPFRWPVEASATVAGGLTMALGAYFGILA